LNFNPDEKIDTGLITRKIAGRVGPGHALYVDATGIALALCGDAIAANFFMVGAALQKGWLPLTLDALERAVQLNGVQVDFNLNAIRLGRLWAHDPAAIATLLRDNAYVPPVPKALAGEALVADRARRLREYQDAGYALRFIAAIDPLRAVEARVAPGQSGLTDAAAQALYRLMAYKDEYEVARLHADPAFHAGIAQQFEGTAKLRFHLAPPLFSRRDPHTGQLVKRQYGAWMLPVFRGLAKLKFLRGTAFDVFGHTAERRGERESIGHYEKLLQTIVVELAPHNHGAAVALASSTLAIRGYGHVKAQSHAKAREEEERLLDAFMAARPVLRATGSV